MIEAKDMLTVIQKYRGDAVVLPVEGARMVWMGISTNQRRDAPSTGPMSKASSWALGLSLARPDIKVILLDGDASLLMSLGSLVTIANMRPKNLYHFVLQNGMNATTGGQPIPCKDVISFTQIARGAGYTSVYDFDNLEDFASQAKQILDGDGPVLVCVKIAPNPLLPSQRGQMVATLFSRSLADATQQFRDDLGVV